MHLASIVEYRVGRANSLPEVGDRTPLLGSRTQSPMPPHRGGAESDGALLSVSPQPAAQRRMSTLNPQYESTIVGSPKGNDQS